MAQKSFPWTNNATGDGTSGGYTALEWGEIWRQAFLGGNEASQGVCKGVANELAVTGTSSPLSVNTGAAFVYGKFYQNTASVNLTVTTPVVGTTGGHVILQLDWTAQTVRLVATRNTDGVNSTPSLTQSTSTQWEIRLAAFTITTGGVITVTDARAYVHMSQRVATANIDDSAVTTAKINSAAVDENKLATSVAGNGLAGGAGTALSVNVDSSTIEINSDTLRVKDAGISTAKLATDSVDDTIAGNRVPQFYRRQGGDASNWSTGGTSTQTPGAVRMQGGVMTLGSIAAGGNGTGSVTFPVAFSNAPLLIVKGSRELSSVGFSSVSSTGFNYEYTNNSGFTVNPFTFTWFAIGPE